MVIDPAKAYTAKIHSDRGAITMQLHADKAPRTVNNFVFLAREGFYDGVIFHRVIEEFMAQGGDPTGTGTGGPGPPLSGAPSPPPPPSARSAMEGGAAPPTAIPVASCSPYWLMRPSFCPLPGWRAHS